MVANKTKTLVTAAFFVALDIIVARFLSFEVPSPLGTVRFDFQLVVAALCGYALGPIWGAMCLAASDILGVMLNSGSLGAFFGFTFSAAIKGFLFGWLLHKKTVKIPRIVIASTIVYIITDFFLSTLWLSIMLHTPYIPLMVSRILPKGVLLVVELSVTIACVKLFEIIKQRDRVPS